MANIKNNAAGQETCRKIIEAAGQVFAERGLHAATLQEITDRAGVNKAAVNYHFHDKNELYAAVVRHAISCSAMEPTPQELEGDPQDRLRAFINHTIQYVFDPNRPAWRTPIMTHEFAQPTEALKSLLDGIILPRSRLLREIVKAILPDDVDEKTLSRMTFSIASQCMFYLYNVGLIIHLHPELPYDAENAKQTAKHIADFSLAALKTLSQTTTR